MADLHFELVTPEKLVRSEDVYMVVVPGTEGEFGVLAGHAPFMTTLRDGELRSTSAGGTRRERIPRCRAAFARSQRPGPDRPSPRASSARRRAIGRRSTLKFDKGLRHSR